MITRRASWADAGQHNDLDFIAGKEGVSEDHSELTLSKRYVLSLTSLALLGINGSDALLETQERLVDLGALSLPVFRVINAV